MNFHVINNDGKLTAMMVIKNNELCKYSKPDHCETIDNVHTCIKYYGSNAIDIIMLMYNNKIPYAIEKNMNTYSTNLTFQYKLVNDCGIPPYKTRQSDSGFDLNLVSINKTIGNITLYGTGVCVVPPSGYYFDMVPRSSMIHTGYMLANSVGIIDQGYTGEVIVPLIKIDPCAQDLELPCKMVQLIPRRWYGFNPILMELEHDNQTPVSTHRGSRGFGSTD
jgi:dUTPase